MNETATPGFNEPTEPEQPSTAAGAILALALAWGGMTDAERKRLEPGLSAEPLRCTQGVLDEALSFGTRDERSALRTMRSQRLVVVMAR